MQKNWVEALPKIMSHLNIPSKNLSIDGKTMFVLYYLPKLFSKARETGKILNLHPVSIYNKI